MGRTVEVVRAKAFELTNPDGKVVARLECTTGPKGGPRLVFVGKDAERLVVSLQGGKPQVMLNSRSGRLVATLVAHEDDKRTFLEIREKNEKGRVTAGVDAKGKPYIEMYDGTEKCIARLPAESGVGR